MISESQLSAWSNQGAVVTAQSTHETIRRAINAHSWPDSVKFDDYLQGSYRNSTNIRGDSDVDIVVELLSTYKPDTRHLNALEKSAYERDSSAATYTYTEFYNEILSLLRTRFGWNAVVPGNMAIKVLPEAGRIPADVVVAMNYVRYYSYDSSTNKTTVEGIAIKNQKTSEWIFNFPKRHYDNGATKNRNTNQIYKPAIRMIKNARQRAVERKLLDPKAAPSYFVEGLMYNILDLKYAGSLQDIYLATVEAAISESRETFKCQNQINKLFGTDSDQWKLDAAHGLARGLLDLAKGS